VSLLSETEVRENLLPQQEKPTINTRERSPFLMATLKFPDSRFTKKSENAFTITMLVFYFLIQKNLVLQSVYVLGGLHDTSSTFNILQRYTKSFNWRLFRIKENLLGQ